jgi:hypothetical protein
MLQSQLADSGTSGGEQTHSENDAPVSLQRFVPVAPPSHEHATRRPGTQRGPASGGDIEPESALAQGKVHR